MMLLIVLRFVGGRWCFFVVFHQFAFQRGGRSAAIQATFPISPGVEVHFVVRLVKRNPLIGHRLEDFVTAALEILKVVLDQRDSKGRRASLGCVMKYNSRGSRSNRSL